nr:lysine-rich arabinogalactan protein 19-like [Ipomoea batatas]
MASYIWVHQLWVYFCILLVIASAQAPEALPSKPPKNPISPATSPTATPTNALPPKLPKTALSPSSPVAPPLPLGAGPNGVPPLLLKGGRSALAFAILMAIIY